MIKFPHKYILYGKVVTITDASANYFYFYYKDGSGSVICSRGFSALDYENLVKDVDILTKLEKIVYGVDE